MLTIPADNQHFLFDSSLPPVATVQAGDEVEFETLDACCGEVRSVADLMWRRESGRPSNPLTGPVWVDGAEPGDTLTVEILQIDLAEDGFQLIGPQRAIVRDEIPEWTCYVFKVVDGIIHFPNGTSLPADPVLGSFGNAPLGEPTNRPNRWGGNQDVPQVRVGAKLYLPVEFTGALFSLGDVHACQGDGEVVGAPEIGARVRVRFGLLKHRHSEWYMIEDADCWHTACTAENEHEAARLAALQNGEFIARSYGIELKDALILLTLIGKLHISRTGFWGDHGPVVTSSFSKRQLEAALGGAVRL